MLQRLIFLGCLFCTVFLSAQVPERTYPPRLVNDYVGLLTPAQTRQLEQELVAFDDSTSNQICLVIVNDLNGMDILDMAYQIGESWKVGQKEFDNGVVIVVKNKTAFSGGQAAIATGYGLEAALTDALCWKIINKDMIPSFKEGRYYEGIELSINHIKEISLGEYRQADQEEFDYFDLLVAFIVFIIIIIVFARIARKNPHSNNDDDFHGGFFIGGFPGGIGGLGGSRGGFGGFGGFGGGSFGGGGAKGGW